MNNYIIVLKGIVNCMIFILVGLLIHIILRIRYKLSNEYKLKKYFQDTALKCFNNYDVNNIYYKYCLKNGFFHQKKKNLIITDRGLEFLKLIYNENNNYLIAFFTFISLIISITAFVISVSDIFVKIIENLK